MRHYTRVFRLFMPPTFATERQTQYARTFHQTTCSIVLIVLVCLAAVWFAQPEVRMRAVVAVVAVGVLALAMLVVNRRGRTRLASLLLVIGLIALVTVLAFTANGIRSPGVTMYFMFVLMTGLLLGQRAGVVAALVCSGLGLMLVVLERQGVLPSPGINYTALTLWLLNCMYIAVVVLLLRLATHATATALERAERELAERRRAEEERARLEQQLLRSQKMEALGTLAGGIAHDFNNILTAIGGNVTLAQAELPRDHPVQATLADVVTAHVRASDLVNQILLFGRRQDAALQPTPLSTIVHEAVTLLRASVPKTIAIREQYADDLPPVLADATQIHQIVMNLGTNATYAMHAGGVLTVCLEREVVEAHARPSANLRPGDHVRLTISDTGEGMSEAVLNRMFEPFFTTKGRAGTGLGLSVVHGIVEAHEGAITVSSTVGQGTAFQIYLPAMAGAWASRPPALADIVAGHGERIMFVDDEKAVLSVMQRMVERLGYSCTGFSDPLAALAAFRENPTAFGAVVTDLSMPGMTGLELARALRGIRPDVRIALTSGHAGYEERTDPAAGVSVFIAKPVMLEDFSRALDSLLHAAA